MEYKRTPNEVQKSDTLNSDVCLGFQSVSATTGHGGQEIIFKHSTYEVICESWFSSKDGESSNNTDILKIPNTISTFKELVSFIRKERPMWSLNYVKNEVDQGNNINDEDTIKTIYDYKLAKSGYVFDCDVWHTLCIDVSNDSMENRLNSYIVVTNYLDRMREGISHFHPNKNFVNFFVRVILYDVAGVNVEGRIFNFDTDKYDLIMFLQNKMLIEPRSPIKGSTMGLKALSTAFNLTEKDRCIKLNSHITLRNVILITTHDTFSSSADEFLPKNNSKNDATLCVLIAPQTPNWDYYVASTRNVCHYYGPLAELVHEDGYSALNSLYNVFDPGL